MLVWRADRVPVQFRVLPGVLKVVWWLLSVLVWRCRKATACNLPCYQGSMLVHLCFFDGGGGRISLFEVGLKEKQKGRGEGEGGRTIL